MATIELFLKVDGISGECSVKGHEKEIALNDFGWGEQSSAAGAASAGLSLGKVTPRDFSIAKAIDVSSVALMKACASGKRLRSALLTAWRSDLQLDYFKIEFSNVLVTSYNIAGNGGGAVPADTATFAFEQVTFIYREIRPDGSLGIETKDTFNFRAMRASRSKGKAKVKAKAKTKAKS